MGSKFGGTWEDPGGGFIKFAVKRALKQDQTLHMEEKLQFILYFSTEWKLLILPAVLVHFWLKMSIMGEYEWVSENPKSKTKTFFLWMAGIRNNFRNGKQIWLF